MSPSPNVGPDFDPAAPHANAPGPVFVSRSVDANAVRDAHPVASDGRALPGLFDRRVRWILLLALALQAFAWWRVDGYQLADSVEFMERARIFVRGEEMVDAGAIRPFGFSFALVPFFALAEWFGMVDQRPIVSCIVVLQMVFGCLLAWRCMRIGAILAGTSGALCAGLVAVTSPVFLRYSTQPVSDIAAGVCVAFAVERLLDRTTFRRALIAGLWLALAFVVAYKTLLITLALLVMLFLRDRWKHSRTWRGVVTGVSVGLLLQCTLDWVMYGQFGASVWNYLIVNAGGPITSIFLRTYWVTRDLGMPVEWFLDRAHETYDLSADLAKTEWAGRTDITARGLQSPWYYLVEIPTMIVWPVVALAVIGVARCVARARWSTSVLLGTLVMCVIIMSNKGSKDFRLWLPLLPLLAPILACGWDWIANTWLAEKKTRREVVAALGSVTIVGLSLHTLTSINVRHFGGYWTAIDWVDARARATFEYRRAHAPVLDENGAPPPLRVGCAYNWAVFLRASPLIEVVKLPYQLNMWKQYEEATASKPERGNPEKTEDFAALEELDVFLVHLPIFSQHPDLLTWINAHYQVVGAFYDQATYEELGPIYVLERLTGDARARRFFRVTRDASAEEFVRARQLDRPMDFVAADASSNAAGDRLELLGVEYETVPPQDLGWITYHWRAPSPLSRDYWVLDRVTAPDERNVWENNHRPGYGAMPTTAWGAGDIVSESYLLVPSHEAYKPQGRVRPIGAGYRRGDLIPTRTWMKVRAFTPESLAGTGPLVVAAELFPARPGATTTVRPTTAEGLQTTPDGIAFSADDFVRVAGFFVRVLAPWRVPDDGRPVPE